MTTNDFGGVSINAVGSAFSVGSGNIVSQGNAGDINLAMDSLIRELSKVQMPKDNKSEIIEMVALATEQTKGKVNKTLLSGIIKSVGMAITAFVMPTEVISAYETWKLLLTPYLN